MGDYTLRARSQPRVGDWFAAKCLHTGDWHAFTVGRSGAIRWSGSAPKRYDPSKIRLIERSRRNTNQAGDQTRVLIYSLVHENGVTSADIAKSVDMHPNSVRHVLAQLCEDGLVSRTRIEGAQRTQYLWKPIGGRK